MARKTKEEALATRGRILDAAEHLFQAQGVSHTTLQDIAGAAGVTRGAVYWHFSDKGALFNAMVDRVCLPMESARAAPAGADAPALPALRAQLLDILTQVAGDAQVRRVFEIVSQKIEYVDELSAVRERHLRVRRDFVAEIERTLRRGQRRGEVTARRPARQLAIGLQALVSGLIQNWMLDPGAFNLRTVGRATVDLYLAALAGD